MENPKSRTHVILEALKDSALNMSDCFEAMLSAGYGASYGKIQFEMGKRERIQNAREAENITRQKFYSLLYKLKKDGFISEQPKVGKKMLSLTIKGMRKLAKIEMASRKYYPMLNYEIEKKPEVTIVAFDVPERDRGKRQWLRAALRSLEFDMIQKSIWFGKAKLPENFIEDLASMDLLDYIEIFEVSKGGTLKRLKT